jgi:hypothetical protein
MPFNPDQPFPKKQGDNIRSKDWNDAVAEIQRLDTAKVNLAGGSITGPLNVSGNVGIGTTTPGFALQVGNPSTVGSLKLCVAGRGSTGNWRQWTLRTGDGDNTADIHKLRIRDEQANADRIIVDDVGNVGIGTTAPTYNLDVQGGFLRAAYNIQTVPPSSPEGGLVVGWNRTGGSAEVNFYNVFNNANLAFQFSQKTGANTSADLLTI